jgi:ankyrin repeat protein
MWELVTSVLLTSVPWLPQVEQEAKRNLQCHLGACGTDRSTPLIRAARKGHGDIVKYFLTSEDIPRRSEEPQRAYLDINHKASITAEKQLLKIWRLDPSSNIRFEMSALDAALNGGWLDIAKDLLEARAKVSDRDTTCCAPSLVLLLESYSKRAGGTYLQVVDQLLLAGADPAALCRRGGKRPDVEVVDCINIRKDTTWITPLVLALVVDDSAIVASLLQEPEKFVSADDPINQLYIDLAITGSKLSIPAAAPLSYFLMKQASDSDGLSVINLLVKAGADPCVGPEPQIQFMTKGCGPPLLIAAKHGWLNSTLALLGLGVGDKDCETSRKLPAVVRLGEKTIEGFTKTMTLHVLDMAGYHGHQAFLEELWSYRAFRESCKLELEVLKDCVLGSEARAERERDGLGEGYAKTAECITWLKNVCDLR